MAFNNRRNGGYGDGQPNDTAGWIELEVPQLAPRDGLPIPFRFVANRYESSSPDAEAFIHDPLGAIIAAKEDGFQPFKNVTREWRVTTLVVNHHRTLSVKHIYVVGTIDDGESTIGLSIDKQAP